MIGNHSSTDPDLSQLAQTILAVLEPIVAASAAAAESGAPGKCAQIWCPLCAVAAAANGEQHPMVAIIAEHSVAVLATLRVLATSGGPAPADEHTAAPDPEGSSPGSRYQPIPVLIHE